MLLEWAWLMIMMTIGPLMMTNSLKEDDDHQHCSMAWMAREALTEGRLVSREGLAALKALRLSLGCWSATRILATT